MLEQKRFFVMHFTPKGWTDSPLTHIGERFNAALHVGLLSSAEPAAVIDPEGRLEQLDEDGLVCLQGREDSTALSRHWTKTKTQPPPIVTSKSRVQIQEAFRYPVVSAYPWGSSVQTRMTCRPDARREDTPASWRG